jgi:predicted nucleotidyltransferase
LFGSVAVGKDTPESDVDLLVEFVPGEAPGGFAVVEMQDELQEVFGGRTMSVLRAPVLDLSPVSGCVAA